MAARGHPLQQHSTVYAGDAVATYPNACGISLDMDASGAAHDSALRSHIAGRGKARANEPLCYSRIQAASDGVFREATIAGEEGAEAGWGGVTFPNISGVISLLLMLQW